MTECLVYTAAEAAEILQVSKPTMYELCQRSDFPVLRIGRKILIPADRLREWVNAQASGG